MNVTVSAQEAPEGPGVAALGLRLFGGTAVYVSPSGMAQILTGER